ncbi:retroviral-like aspartic protease family protein [Acetobacter fallax]|nr:retroviral-like aspartic protease family protein [Acetobacter fallax]
MTRMATLRVFTSWGPPIVQVSINGKPAAMALSTGAETSTISSAAAKEFGLEEGGDSTRVYGTTGPIDLPVARSNSLLVGRASASDFAFIEIEDRRHSSSAPVPRIDNIPIVGELGADFLRSYEVQFDLPDGEITLARPRGCTVKDVRWDDSVSQVPVRVWPGGRPGVQIRLNGHKINAMLSSSSTTTTVTPEELSWDDIKSNMEAENHAEIVRGVNGTAVTAHRDRFDSLQIGNETFSPAWLTVSPMQITDAVLGADFLRRRVFWLSVSQHMMYIEKEKINPFGAEHPRLLTSAEEPKAEPVK